MKPLNTLAMLSILVLCACATATPQGSSIVIVAERQALGAQCQSLGQMQAQSGWGGLAATGAGYNDALNDLKNQAAARGGTHLLMINSSNTVGGTNMIGDAYRCGRES